MLKKFLSQLYIASYFLRQILKGTRSGINCEKVSYEQRCCAGCLKNQDLHYFKCQLYSDVIISVFISFVRSVVSISFLGRLVLCSNFLGRSHYLLFCSESIEILSSWVQNKASDWPDIMLPWRLMLPDLISPRSLKERWRPKEGTHLETVRGKSHCSENVLPKPKSTGHRDVLWETG